jgi:acyl-coenzyme A synthetase/AMP-(fatty) acid ligase/acyl carrier protein
MSAFQPAELAGVLASTSLCFDLSVFEIYVPLSCGGTVILARNALALPELPAANKVTLINTVPSAMTELVALNRIPASVRTVTLCGEILHRSLADGIYARSTANRVVNLYGPTESTTYSTYIDLPRVASVEPPIGRPLEGTQVYLLDTYLAPVPLGAVGDLYLGGAGLARGYVGLPDVTAEKFLPNPFADAPGSRLYATGDIARFQPNGELEFLGRRDHQIKLRGFRIELGEIECALLGHEAVAETVATARREEPGGMRLVAYVVPRSGLQLTADQLREFLSAWLPAYAVPSAFVLLDALPRTPNGKINRNALPAPEAAQVDASSFIEPSTSAELLLAQIWRDVLKIERVGIHDHFFHLGGHSLMATRVIARLREALQLEVPLRSIFEAPTIARFSRKVEQLLEEQIAASNDPPAATSIKLQEQS